MINCACEKSRNADTPGQYWPPALLKPKIMNIPQYIHYFYDKNPEHKSLANKGPRDKTEDCLHSSCSECAGSGVKKNGGACVHMISCRCSKCGVH